MHLFFETNHCELIDFTGERNQNRSNSSVASVADISKIERGMRRFFEINRGVQVDVASTVDSSEIECGMRLFFETDQRQLIDFIGERHRNRSNVSFRFIEFA